MSQKMYRCIARQCPAEGKYHTFSTPDQIINETCPECDRSTWLKLKTIHMFQYDDDGVVPASKTSGHRAIQLMCDGSREYYEKQKRLPMAGFGKEACTCVDCITNAGYELKNGKVVKVEE